MVVVNLVWIVEFSIRECLWGVWLYGVIVDDVVEVLVGGEGIGIWVRVLIVIVIVVNGFFGVGYFVYIDNCGKGIKKCYVYSCFVDIWEEDCC